MCVNYSNTTAPLRELIPFAVFMTDLNAYFQQLVATSGQLLILADFNVNVDEQSQDNKAAVFMDFLRSLNLEQHVKEPTQIDYPLRVCGSLLWA